jgi:aspartate ammonia-lyase
MSFRTEKDFLGEKQLPDNAYYGVQTQRGKENFRITGMPMSAEPEFVQAPSATSRRPRRWPTATSACWSRASPTPSPPAATGSSPARCADQFLTDFIQGGAGTSTNMNANEVIANLALEHLGHARRASTSTSTRTTTSTTGNRPTTSIPPRSAWR